MKTPKKLVFAMVFAMSASFFNLNAQCTFEKTNTENDKQITVLPCNFPMLDFSKATETEKNDFKNLVSIWRLTNKGFDGISFVPETTNEYFQIDASAFALFSEEKKAIVNAMPFYYRVKK